ncbi:craniofacial development protein 2-like [Capsicum annuum]|uniref:craniofacial development protein 2-like n=1 Tax=Capsicum annuum TaxID=4072 RepID=UPI001FB196AB|nr:craniofacial development protein 2-like [Capsicum annuum]
MDGYKLWYLKSERRGNGVGILVDKELRGQVVEVKRVSDRKIKIKLVIEGFTLHVCSVYAPQVGLEEEVKEKFWEDLDEVVRSMPSSEKIIIAGDFNGHIGVLSGGYDDVYGGFGSGDRNGKGASLLDFARAFGLVVHRLLVMDLSIKKSKKRKKRRAGEGRPKIKCGGLMPVSALEIRENMAGMGL